MTLNLNVPTIQSNLTPRITVIGVGGAGGNAVNNMIQLNLEGVEFLIANTDAQAIGQSLCERRIQLGRSITQGLGAGSRPDIGRAATEEALDEILSELEGTNMVFITAGMGGGTGTGGAPVIARAAREAGILTVGVVTKPFHFEGVHRMRLAEAGITDLTQHVDTLIIIPNQNLFRVADEKTTFADAFKMADDVLHSGVRGVTDLMVMPGLINLDFADIRAVMTEMGKAMMGTGEAEGENRALAAAEAAISNPLLDEVSMRGARGVLINITGGPDMTLFEVDETANRIRDEVDPDANIIFGSTFEQSLEGRMRVSVVATGIDADAAVAPRPVTLSLVSDRNQAGTAQRAASGVASDGATAVAGDVTRATAEAPEAPPETPVETRAETRAETPVETAAAEPMEQPGIDDVAAQPAVAAMGGGDLYTYSQEAPQGVDARAERRQPSMATPEAAETAALAESERAVTAAESTAAESTAAESTAGESTAAESFIAPPPVEADVTPAAKAKAAPDPFAAAAMANAPPPPRKTGHAPAKGFDRKKAQGLFAKMTGGAARALQAATLSGEQRGPGQSEGARAAPAAGSATPARPPAEPAAQPPSKPGAGPTAQPSLSGLDQSERAGAGRADEELLDIPAFLRRQAN